MAYVRCSNGGGTGSIKDIIRDKVLNGGFATEFPVTIYQSRYTINEGGKIVVDTDNRKCYFYIDMTMLQASSSSDWRSMGTFGSTISNYLPKNTANNRNTYVALICDDTSDNNVSSYVGYLGSSYSRNFGIGYAETFAINDRIILYGSWTY